jgi:hypothetical protein
MKLASVLAQLQALEWNAANYEKMLRLIEQLAECSTGETRRNWQAAKRNIEKLIADRPWIDHIRYCWEHPDEPECRSYLEQRPFLVEVLKKYPSLLD